MRNFTYDARTAQRRIRIGLGFLIAVMLAWAANGDYAPGKQRSAAAASTSSVQAAPSVLKLSIDGRTVSFEAYTIKGNRYIKIRDFAMALKNSDRRFAVTSDSVKKTTDMLPGKPYAPIGGELTLNTKRTRQKPTAINGSLSVNGVPVPITAYAIKGVVYYPLGGLCRPLGLSVTTRSSDRSTRLITYAEMSVKATTHDAQVAFSDDYDYQDTFKPATRYLYRSGQDTYLVELQYGTVYVTRFDARYKPVSQTKIHPELPMVGGFHHDAEGYNYIVSGVQNFDLSEDRDVYQIVKYDASWKKVARLKIRGVDAYRPFTGSNVTIDSSEGKLVVHSGKQRSDYHQANMTFVVDTEKMEVLELISSNFVSHSFATYARFDGDRIVYADHGDANPRAMVLQAGTVDGYAKQYVELMAFDGESGDNYTGATLGGLEVGDSHYLVTGANSVRTFPMYGSAQNVFLSVVPKTAEDDREVKTVWLTKYAEQADVRIKETHVSKLSEHEFVVMWNEIKKSTGGATLYYAVVDDDGTLLRKPKKLAGVPSPGNLSPLVSGNTLTWYYTAGSGLSGQTLPNVMEFYTLTVN